MTLTICPQSHPNLIYFLIRVMVHISIKLHISRKMCVAGLLRPLQRLVTRRVDAGLAFRDW